MTRKSILPNVRKAPVKSGVGIVVVGVSAVRRRS